MSKTATPTHEKVLSIRTEADTIGLIDRAAVTSGKSRSAFMLDAARKEAEDVLQERTQFTFDAREWTTMVAALDAPVSKEERRRVAALLQRKPLWERGQ